MKIATGCPKLDCDGELELISKSILLQMRKKKSTPCTQEMSSLKCSKCTTTCSSMSRIEAVLDHGFQRCFGRPRLTDGDVKQLISKGIPRKPKSNDIMELDRWLLNLSSIHVLVNMHDWKHRRSCFKRTDSSCRYKIPQIQVYQTSVNPIFSNTSPTHGQDSTLLALNTPHKEEIMQLVIDILKKACFYVLNRLQPDNLINI